MRVLYLPWSELSQGEQEVAIGEAHRRGGLCACADAIWYRLNGGEPLPAARPDLYLCRVLPQVPEPWNRQWRRQRAAGLCDDPRVCVFGNAWERTRRSLMGEPALPEDAAALARWAREAHGAWAAARREYRERMAALEGAEALPAKHPARVAAGAAQQRVTRTQDEYWLAVMLAQVAEWKTECPEGNR